VVVLFDPASNSLVGNANLISKVCFLRLIVSPRRLSLGSWTIGKLFSILGALLNFQWVNFPRRGSRFGPMAKG